MASKAAVMGANGIPAAGLYADQSLDGPEIGTLVLVVDRAKNLPNRKTMGKQNPYCAARLGKEAQKTEVDKRGGQTPRWDQELRFTVHDSPDFYNLKISVFSEDKRTDLIGEAWVNLAEVVVAGGGKNDLWQGLNCKGKYAGEIRIELTYYDSRPKPEKPLREAVAAEGDSLRQDVGSGSRVKRRPLPGNPNSAPITPDAHGEAFAALSSRAKHGPRDYRTPPRTASMPPAPVSQERPPSSHGYAPPYEHSPQASVRLTPPNQHLDDPQAYDRTDGYDEPYAQQDLLPQLPPSNRLRGATSRDLGPQSTHPEPLQVRPHHQSRLPHSHSAPIVPSQYHVPYAHDGDNQVSTEYPEPIPDLDYQHQQLRQRRMDIPPSWQSEYGEPYAPLQEQEDYTSPPPPPMHSNSAPIVPHFPNPHRSAPSSAYSAPTPGTRHHSVPNVSPLQSVERRYGQTQRAPIHCHPARGRSMDNYAPLPEHNLYGTQSVGSQVPASYTRNVTERPTNVRHSMADSYRNTPPRPHPLSQEVPRARSPTPYTEYLEHSPQIVDEPSYQHDYRGRDAPPLIKPRALSPRPPLPEQPASRPRNSFSLQYPVRAFESSDDSPLSTSLPPIVPPANRTPIARKSLSPHPTPPDAGIARSNSIPYSPDDYDVHNPNALRASHFNDSPTAPYQVRPGAEAHGEEPKGPIVGWHGQEIDPSDHLPVDSWAPEPEKKTPTKTYGLGRDRDFGPRSAQSTPNSGGRLGKDTVINVRMKSAASTPNSEPAISPTRGGKLVKRNAGGLGREQQITAPLREHYNYNSNPSSPVPDLYAGQAEYSRSFTDGRPAYGGPGMPPKVPLEYGEDALAREIGSIDIGAGPGSRYARPANGGVPPPTAYVPVRSHRDRQTYC
ncbi:hypothetical protein BAUCODRAFT_27751 [Baudoinia panamericana UAMH 10762]|uniref:C2 domain-containing protein n=1 Tax=Baudoinia panamericana (strain UAMH 10762) TaxID=717646 RepID=M2LEP7_BAUPA|nr:uncharacterized protein BAUCODRAFT_27751 [Baudoinia panamericana UAMH 10762]EMC92472.1 hypothetical protein BAUCODRAFT_27751 [Baudoinia panamericana UAMH 10762]